MQQNPFVLFQSCRNFLASFFFGAFLFFFMAPAALSQVGASITGTVQDTSGAVVPGAKVTIKNMETQAHREVSTDDAGRYRVLGLGVGIYELRVQKPGFEDALWSGIKLDVGQEKVEDIRLSVSVAAQEVTVTETTAQAPVVNTTTSQLTGLVEEQQVKDLPLNGRGYDKLITLNPGTADFSNLRSANTTTSNGSAFVVDGQKPGDNQFLLNGVEITGASQLAISPGGVSGGLLGVDAIREFNLLSGNYGAEYGKRSGGQVTVVTRSGTNAVHGTVYEFLRNNVLDARSYFSPKGTDQTLKRNQFGASLGAPIIKDRLFVFGNYEGLRQRCSGLCSYTGPLGPVIANVPGTAARAATDATMQPYLFLWPTPNPALGDLDNQPGGVAKIFRNPPSSIDEDFGTLRLDYVVGPRDTLTGAYTIDNGRSIVPLPDPFFASALSVGSQTFSLQETHVFSPQLVNSFIFGYSRAAFSNDSVLTDAFLANLPPGITPDTLALVQGRGPGGITFSTSSTTSPSAVTAAGPNNASSVANRRNLFTFADNVQISKGRHQLGLGVWFQRLQDNENTASRQLGVLTFANLASFQNGTASNFQVIPQATELGWRSFLGAWYVQDTVKVRRNLTVTLGLRHEFDNGWNEVQGRAANYGVNAGGALIPPCLLPPAVSANPCVPLGSSAFTENNAKKLFGPRLALAWDPFGHGSTAVHAGFGIYYSLLDALAFQLNSTQPFNGSLTITPPAGAPDNILAIPIPYDSTAAIPQQCGTAGAPAPPACAKYSPQGVQQNAKVPTVQKWNLSVEQRLSNTMTLRIGYLGSFGYHELLNNDPNTVVPAICAPGQNCIAGGVAASGQPVGSVPNTPSPTPFVGGPGGTPYIPWSATPCGQFSLNKFGCRPNPALSSGFFWLTNGNSSYHALQVDVTKRYSEHLQFRANYTFSKSLDINSAPTGAQANNQAQMVLDRFDVRRDWGPSALNPTHAAHFSATYELPFGRGQRWGADAKGAADKLVSGWVLNMITTLQSGFPITPQVGNNISGTGDTRNPDRPVLDPNFHGSIVTGDPNQWFNPNAFLMPTPGFFGLLQADGSVLPSIGRGTFRGPGLAEVDISLFKDTRLSERVRMEFRTECFNVLNHPNFNTPNLIVFANSAGVRNTFAGQITSTVTPSRQIQFGLKLIY